MRYVILFALVCGAIVLTGCEDRFRYFCQDPKNWEAEKCQRPQCAVTGTCPDQLVNTKEMKGEQ